MRDPHFRWQAGSSLPCHSFHRMWVSGASITTLNHKKRALVLSDVQCILNVPPSWSFLNGLLNHVVKELNVEEALKSSILVVHKAAAVGCGDFQFLFRIFLAFGPNSPMTIRFILVCLRMFLSVWKTLHAYHILREQPNFNLYRNNMNFRCCISLYILNRDLMNDH